MEPIETNIVIFELIKGVNENDFVQKLADNNILIIGMGGGKLEWLPI